MFSRSVLKTALCPWRFTLWPSNGFFSFLFVRLRLLLIVAVVVLLACENGFDPRGTFEDRLVLFSVLTPATDTIQVRLQSTYDPPAQDPLSHTTEPTLSGTAASLLWSRGGMLALRDTVVPHPNPGRYTTGLHLLTGVPLRVERGEIYTVRVDVPGYPRAEGTATVPGTAPFYFQNEDVLSHPSDYLTLDMDLLVGLPPDAFGFLPRLYVEYVVLSADSAVERIEVPSSLRVSVNGVDPIYPTLRGSSVAEERTIATVELSTFKTDAYQFALAEVRDRYGLANVRFLRAILYVTLVDEHLYKYYFLVNGFFDPYSVRTDQPDYSNVIGGVGLVGAYTVDSLSVSLPSTIN